MKETLPADRARAQLKAPKGFGALEGLSVRSQIVWAAGAEMLRELGFTEAATGWTRMLSFPDADIVRLEIEARAA